jgi:TetR/AcrR family transcriptional repressor of nem operon
MRYPKEHKEATRRRILATAAELFRRHGYDGVSIDRLMDACGLTRGGFYGHFRSKRDLYRAVLGGEHGFLNLMRARGAEDVEGLARQAEQVVCDYLAPAHRKRVVRGCTLASLAIDTARAGAPAQRTYAGVVRELAAEFGRGLEGARPLDERALAALVACVGGLMVAAACGADRELSDAISEAARKAALGALA